MTTRCPQDRGPLVAMRAARPFSPVSPCMEAIYDTAAQQLRISPVHLNTRHMSKTELLQVALRLTGIEQWYAWQTT